MAGKVLLVDDEPNVLTSLERLLRHDGYEIIKAEGGKAAIEALGNSDDIALIICDQRMPDLSGAEVLKESRRLRPDTVRIALTGYLDSEVIMQCINTGQVSRFVLKPWDDNAMRDIVRDAVAGYDATISNQQLEQLTKEQNLELKELNARLEEKVQERTEALKAAKENLELALSQVVEVLSDLMEAHAGGLRGHAKRVADLSMRLAEAIELGDEEIASIETAALLHDIGLVSIPAELASKCEDLLTSKETVLLRRHPLVGFEVLKNIIGFEDISLIVRHHHERAGGAGYPDRLSGAEIPLGARIIAVADTFDKNLYPLDSQILGSLEQAKVLLRKKAGTALDKDLVGTFLDEVLSASGYSDSLEVEVSIDMLQPGMVLAEHVVNVNGIPLLKSGTELSKQLIERLSRNEELDPVVSKIFVARRSMPVDLQIAGTPAPKAVESEDSDAGKPVVVVVDDEEHIINAIQRELRPAGYEVKGCTTPEEGLDQIRKRKDVYALITDYNMPNITGDQLIALAQKERPNLPCIVITGLATRKTVLKLTEAGRLIRVLAKPWDKTELLATLRGLRDEK